MLVDSCFGAVVVVTVLILVVLGPRIGQNEWGVGE